MGGNGFCMKICDPAGQNQQALCQNIYDRLGCAYNAPNNAKDGIFEICEGDDMTPPGVYTSNGQTMTYFQPPESLGPITTVPYTPVVPASSNCVTYSSAALYSGQPAPTAGPSGATAKPTATGGSGSGSSKPSSGSGSAGAPAPTSNSASSVGVSAASGIVGVLFAVAFLS